MAKKLVRWYHSKTIIWNGIIGVLASIPEILSFFNVSVLKALNVTHPESFYTLLGVSAAIINVLLRAHSSTPSAPIKTKARAKKLY